MTRVVLEALDGFGLYRIGPVLEKLPESYSGAYRVGEHGWRFLKLLALSFFPLIILSYYSTTNTIFSNYLLRIVYFQSSHVHIR